MAGDEHSLWARLNAGLYTECYTARALPVVAHRDLTRGGQAEQAAGSKKRLREAVGTELEQ